MRACTRERRRAGGGGSAVLEAFLVLLQKIYHTNFEHFAPINVVGVQTAVTGAVLKG